MTRVQRYPGGWLSDGLHGDRGAMCVQRGKVYVRLPAGGNTGTSCDVPTSFLPTYLLSMLRNYYLRTVTSELQVRRKAGLGNGAELIDREREARQSVD